MSSSYTAARGLPMVESELSERVVLDFAPGTSLKLIDFTGLSLMLLGADATVTAANDYAIPQEWSLALHTAFPAADGLIYTSKHINNKTAVAVFDRARAKLKFAAFTPLLAEPGFAAVSKTFRISLV